jgi:hypothetical protein
MELNHQLELDKSQNVNSYNQKEKTNYNLISMKLHTNINRPLFKTTEKRLIMFTRLRLNWQPNQRCWLKKGSKNSNLNTVGSKRSTINTIGPAGSKVTSTLLIKIKFKFNKISTILQRCPLTLWTQELNLLN